MSTHSMGNMSVLYYLLEHMEVMRIYQNYQTGRHANHVAGVREGESTPGVDSRYANW